MEGNSTSTTPLGNAARGKEPKAVAGASSRKAERARQAALDLPIDLTRSDCKLLAIQQFTCEYIPNVAINCKPLWRVFQVCGGKSLEVTPFAQFDESTGEASIKPDILAQAGKNWHDLLPSR